MYFIHVYYLCLGRRAAGGGGEDLSQSYHEIFDTQVYFISYRNRCQGNSSYETEFGTDFKNEIL